MALRILSGMIFIPRGGAARGSIDIGFNPFQIIASSNAAFELRKEQEIGPRARFVRRPASIVAARQFCIVPIKRDWRVQLSDRVTRDSLRITWNTGTQRVDQEEIPFMIVGEVPDYVTVAPPVGTPVGGPGAGLRRSSRRSKGTKR